MIVIRSSLLALVTVLLSAQACFCDSTDDLWKPWLVVMSPQAYPQTYPLHYLDYPGSKLHPMIRVEINFAQPDNGELYSYEDLFYVKERAVGCRRWNVLDITRGTAGVVRVQKFETDQLYAVTNALKRVYLELCLDRCMIKYIKIPLERFDDVVEELCRRGFYRQSQGPHLSIMLVSEPAGKMQTLML